MNAVSIWFQWLWYSKGKGATPKRLRRSAHFPDIGHWARRWIDHWVREAWLVQRQTYSYLPSHTASPPFDHRYQNILFGEQRHMCVNNLPKVLVIWQSMGQELNQWRRDHPGCPTLDYRLTLQVRKKPRVLQPDTLIKSTTHFHQCLAIS